MSHAEQVTPADTIAYFDRIAGIYDEASANEWTFSNQVAELLGEQLLVAPSVLDVGSGTGQTVAAIMHATDRPHITAVDPSAAMLEQLRSRTVSASPAVQPVQSTIENYLKDTGEVFDLITAVGTCEFIEDLPATLGQLAVHLAPEGLLMATYIPQTAAETKRVFTIPSLDSSFVEYYWQPAVIRTSLTQNGLSILDETAVTAYQRGDETVMYNLSPLHVPLRSNTL